MIQALSILLVLCAKAPTANMSFFLVFSTSAPSLACDWSKYYLASSYGLHCTMCSRTCSLARSFIVLSCIFCMAGQTKASANKTPHPVELCHWKSRIDCAPGQRVQLHSAEPSKWRAHAARLVSVELTIGQHPLVVR